jgi:hypothetical protein
VETQPPATTSGGPPAVKDDEKMFALLAHLSPLACLAFIGPIVALLAKQDSEFVKYHAIQALVYQAVATIAVLTIYVVTCGLGSPLGILVVVGSVYVGIQAYGGSWQGYPLLDSIGRPAHLG